MKELSFHKGVSSVVFKLSGQKNVLSIPRIYVDYMGSLGGGIFLSQLIYWTGVALESKEKGISDFNKKRKIFEAASVRLCRLGWFFKTYKEWKEEICVGENTVRKASKFLADKGILKTQIKKAIGRPAVHYLFDLDEFLGSFSDYVERRKEEEERRERESQESDSANIRMDPLKRGDRPLKKEEEERRERESQESDSANIRMDPLKRGGRPLKKGGSYTETTTKTSTSKDRSRGGPGKQVPPSNGFFDNGKDKTHKKKLKPRTCRHEEWDVNAGKYLKGILVQYDTDIQRTRVETLASHIYLLRINGKKSKDRIRELLKWLKEHYNDDFVPRLHKAKDISSKFKSFEEAMGRDESSDLSEEEQNIRDGREYLNVRFDDPYGGRALAKSRWKDKEQC